MDKKTGSDLFIVDNSDEDWKVLHYLSEWAEISSRFDNATGYFEIGALLALDGQWQKLEGIRILMGNEVSKRTQQALLAGTDRIKSQLDASIEREKLKNDSLTGVPAILEALSNGRIACRIYAKKKFHAKAHITHSKLAVVGSSALVAELLDRDLYDVPQILSESLQNLNQLAEFLNELRQFKPTHDDKLRALIQLLKTDPVLKKHKGE